MLRKPLNPIPLECGGMTIVFREVPALVCENSGEAFHDEAITAALLKQAEQDPHRSGDPRAKLVY